MNLNTKYTREEEAQTNETDGDGKPQELRMCL